MADGHSHKKNNKYDTYSDRKNKEMKEKGTCNNNI